MPKRKKPPEIAQEDWDAADSPPLTDEELASMRPLRESFPDLAAYAAKRKRRQHVAQQASTK